MKQICKFCYEEKAFTRESDFKKHESACSKNPKNKNRSLKLSNEQNQRNNIRLGEYKDFQVFCSGFQCNRTIIVNEREKQYPTKEKYFCNRSCANSRGPRSEKDKESIRQGALSFLENLTEEQQKERRQKPKKPKSCYAGKPLKSKEIIISICKKCKSGIQDIVTRSYHKECVGGYRPGSGRGKSGYYKGVQCDSTWELAYVIYNLEHNIKFERNTQKFDYIDPLGQNSKYIPDYILEDGSFVEIKGVKTEYDDLKWKSFPHKLSILFEEELKEIFKYVKEKYGNNFIELYEGNPHDYKTKKCFGCDELTYATNKFCSSGCSTKYHAKIRKQNKEQKF